MGKKTDIKTILQKNKSVYDNLWNIKYLEKKKIESPLYIFIVLEIKQFLNKIFKDNGLLLHDYKINFSEFGLKIFVSYLIKTQNKKLSTKLNDLYSLKKIQLIDKEKKNNDFPHVLLYLYFYYIQDRIISKLNLKQKKFLKKPFLKLSPKQKLKLLVRKQKLATRKKRFFYKILLKYSNYNKLLSKKAKTNKKRLKKLNFYYFRKLKKERKKLAKKIFIKINTHLTKTRKEYMEEFLLPYYFKKVRKSFLKIYQKYNEKKFDTYEEFLLALSGLKQALATELQDHVLYELDFFFFFIELKNIGKKILKTKFNDNVIQIFKKKNRQIPLTIETYKNYLKLIKYKSLIKIKINAFLEKIIEGLNIFTKNKFNIKLILHQVSSETCYLFTKPQLQKIKNIISQLRLFKDSKFFFEGINVITLALNKKNSSELLAKFVSYQLTKKKNNFFLKFLNRLLITLFANKLVKVKSIKIVIKGRLNRSPRSKKRVIFVGKKNMSLMSFNSNIQYFKTNSFSPNGTFGIKVWVKNNLNT